MPKLFRIVVIILSFNSEPKTNPSREIIRDCASINLRKRLNVIPAKPGLFKYSKPARRERQTYSPPTAFLRRPGGFCTPYLPRYTEQKNARFSLRKEVIQPQVLLQLPCYDFTPITSHTLGAGLLAVSSTTSSATCFRDVTGGVYKARERIHRGVLIRDY
jgi:hypothetical protein